MSWETKRGELAETLRDLDGTRRGKLFALVRQVLGVTQEDLVGRRKSTLSRLERSSSRPHKSTVEGALDSLARVMRRQGKDPATLPRLFATLLEGLEVAEGTAEERPDRPDALAEIADTLLRQRPEELGRIVHDLAWVMKEVAPLARRRRRGAASSSAAPRNAGPGSSGPGDAAAGRAGRGGEPKGVPPSGSDGDT